MEVHEQNGSDLLVVKFVRHVLKLKIEWTLVGRGAIGQEVVVDQVGSEVLAEDLGCHLDGMSVYLGAADLRLDLHLVPFLYRHSQKSTEQFALRVGSGHRLVK